MADKLNRQGRSLRTYPQGKTVPWDRGTSHRQTSRQIPATGQFPRGEWSGGASGVKVTFKVNEDVVELASGIQGSYASAPEWESISFNSGDRVPVGVDVTVTVSPVPNAVVQDWTVNGVFQSKPNSSVFVDGIQEDADVVAFLQWDAN